MRYFLWKRPNPDFFWLSRGQTGPTECYMKATNSWDKAVDVHWIMAHSIEISYQEAIKVILNQAQETVDLILREKQK